MGTWGPESFQNDWARDWLSDLCKSKDATLVREVLGRVVKNGGTKRSSPSILERLLGRHEHIDWLTARVAAHALAAAEIVAAWRGLPSANLPEGTMVWLQQHGTTFQPDLIPLARTAVSIVKTNSELKDLWEEGDSTNGKMGLRNWSGA